MLARNNTSAISVRNLTVAYKDEPVLWDINVDVPAGLLLGVIGPNGAGKTTFLKALLGLAHSTSGYIRLLGKTYQAVRREVAYVSQRTVVDWDFPIHVLDVVLMGRYPHIGWMRRPKAVDIDCAFSALEKVGLVHYADRPIGQLSGGQQQRVFLARALVQEAQLYLLDEPFIGVDIVTEKLIIEILKQLRTAGKTIVVVHHDVQTLADYFDWLLLLNRKCIAFGRVEDVLVQEYMCAAYGGRNLFVRHQNM